MVTIRRDDDPKLSLAAMGRDSFLRPGYSGGLFRWKVLNTPKSRVGVLCGIGPVMMGAQI